MSFTLEQEIFSLAGEYARKWHHDDAYRRKTPTINELLIDFYNAVQKFSAANKGIINKDALQMKP